MELAREWLASPELRRLSGSLGGPRHPAEETPALARWSAETLDTRGGRERQEAIPVRSSESRRALLLELAEVWGMLETADPRDDSYTATVLLGGTATANRMRTGRAAHYAAQGTGLGLLIGASAKRRLGDQERRDDPEVGSGSSESENLLGNLERRFGPLVLKSRQSGGCDSQAWEDVIFTAPDGRLVRLIVGPAGEGRVRANTLDVLTFLRRRIELSDCRRILLVTSAIYVSYQFFISAPALLGAGARSIELVGTPTARAGGPDLLAQRLAQETHATIRAALAVLERSSGLPSLMS